MALCIKTPYGLVVLFIFIFTTFNSPLNMSIRSSSYNHDEDILLCRVYMEISQDPCVGVYQSSDRFWTRVEECYNKERPQEWEIRTKRSMQARIRAIEKAARALHGCIRKVENRHQSGASSEDIMQQAKVLFRLDEKYKSGWKYDHVWNLIKDFEKFQDCARNTRQPSFGCPSSDSDIPTSDSQASPGLSSFSVNLDDDDNVLGGSPSERPIGVKKAKLKRKKESDASSLINFMKEENKQLKEEFKKTNSQMEYHLGVHNALKNKSNTMKEIKEDNKILMTDTSAIKDPRIRAHVQAQQSAVLQKRAQQDPQYFNNIGGSSSGSLDQYFNNIGGSDSGLPDY